MSILMGEMNRDWATKSNRGPIVDCPGLGRVGEGLSQEAMTGKECSFT